MCNLYESSKVVQLVTGKKGLITNLNSEYASSSMVETSLTNVGEQLFISSAFLTVQAMVLLNSSEYRMPETCVKCGSEARPVKNLGISSLGRAAFGAFWGMKKVSLPYCDLHSPVDYPGALSWGAFLGPIMSPLRVQLKAKSSLENSLLPTQMAKWLRRGLRLEDPSLGLAGVKGIGSRGGISLGRHSGMVCLGQNKKSMRTIGRCHQIGVKSFSVIITTVNKSRRGRSLFRSLIECLTYRKCASHLTELHNNLGYSVVRPVGWRRNRNSRVRNFGRLHINAD